ncbi:hypothetical protein EV652_103645 [Kribbella steppae]|uniref:Uncharacterized protein n=1 Tax=Kribbella steppae TaxID=2512223 RepID=A0A4R2HQY5_9ACTN|nr:hypothetical protein [Kribbella steppae]TCO33643.1 hypothetical protein EV652_103645 [Kribbella steppae]
MPKLKLGAAVYAVVAIAFAVEFVRMIRHDGQWSGVHGWEFAALLIVAALTTALLALGAVTRRGLIADDGPWICRHGWIVLLGVVACALAVQLIGSEELGIWPSPAIVFLPHFVRRMHESYSDGVSEGERELEIRAAVRDEELPPAR